MTIVVHCVTFTWRDGVPDEAVDDLEADLATLRDRLALRDYAFGRDLGLAAGNADFGVVARFAGESDWRTYMDDPQHRRIIADRVAPILASKSAFQIRAE